MLGLTFLKSKVLHQALLVIVICLCLQECQPQSDISTVLPTANASVPWHMHIHQDSLGRFKFNVSIEEVTQEESYFFIRHIFREYGSPDRIEYQNLVDLLDHLSVGKCCNLNKGKRGDSSHDHSSHGDGGHDDNHDDNHDDDHDDNHDHADHSGKDISKRSISKSRTKRNLPKHTHKHTDHDQCQSLNDMLDAFHMIADKQLSAKEFAYLCPALIYQLDKDTCHEHRADTDVTHAIIDDIIEEKISSLSDIPAKVWGYSFLSVFIISLVGLLGVAVIPIMQKVFYNHLLQFLVALAVGALAGDALLHLLPHAIMGAAEAEKGHGSHGSDKEYHDHSAGAWKGLAALAGILFFFITERLLTIITIIKRNKKSNKQQKKRRCEKFCDVESDKKSVSAKLSHRISEGDDGCDRTVMMVHPNKALKSFADAAHDEYMHQCDEEHDAITPITEVSLADNFRVHNHSEDEAEAELMELAGGETGHSHHKPAVTFSHSHGGHSHGGHGHKQGGGHGGHSHGGHSHSVPKSASAVAWMVILGDGIHNFSDGLAIGAAFANSMTGGFSTSVAVFCHELPHEIGDFAVLLRAGMSPKQAILYNILSSILCFFGMLIGVAIGNIAEASLWIFAVVGGMFLYIALVDMLPEMSQMHSKEGENPFLHLLFQVLGICMGSGIMLLIALYENDIKRAFDSD